MLLKKAINAASMARVAATLYRQNAVRCMSGQTPAHWKTDKELDMIHKVHMDCMPVPQDSWQENYNRRNRKMNMMVVASSLFLVATIITMQQQNCFYFHEIPDYKKVKLSGPGLKYE